MTVVEARNLRKQYGKNMALKDVSFTIREGETIGLIGPNGAGKSTVMNILCGYLAPTAGSVKICGIDMNVSPAQARSHIGYLPEIPPVYADMTVEEQVRFACALSGMKRGKKLEETVDALCEMTKITHMRRRLIRSLSKGYRQRVAISQLLAGDPQILVLDEPTVGLDPRQIREFRDLFLELGKTHTVIFSSHILSEINSICDRVLIFEKGELLADGDPDVLAGSLEKEKRIRLSLAGAPQDLEDQIRQLAGVKRVEEEPAGTDGEILNLTVTFEETQEDLRGLNRALRAAGCDILRMEKQQLSLEDIYLKITRKRDSNENDL